MNKVERLASIRAEIEQRMGLCPSFFVLAGDSPEKLEALWRQAQEAYVDNPLPSLFKEKLCTYLSRFSLAPYCMVRHAGFLLGRGNIAGDPACKPLTPEEVVFLLKRPFPSPRELQAWLRVLAAAKGPLRNWPKSGGKLETAIVVCAASVFLGRGDHGRCLKELRRLLGPESCEQLLGLLAFVRSAHFWTETHPELELESDMYQLLAETPALDEYVRDYSTTVSEELERPGGGVDLSSHKASLPLAPEPGHPGRAPGESNGKPQEKERWDQSQARFGALLQNAPVAIVIHGGDGRLLRCNATAERLLGVSQAGARGRTLGAVAWQLLREDGSPLPMEEFPVAQVLARGAPVAEMVVGVRRAKGQRPSWMLVHALPNLTEEGSVAEVVVVFMDITRHKQAEDALRQSQLLNQRITDVIPAVIYVHDVVENRPLFASRQVLGTLGFTPELTAEMMLRSLEVLMHPDDRDGMIRHLGRLEQLADGEFLEMEYRLCHADGTWHWFQARDAVFARDEAGRVRQIIGCSFDVTERKRAEEALRASEERLRQSEVLQHAIFQALPAHMAVVDREGRIVAVNKAWSHFAAENGGEDLPSVQVGANYLNVCGRAAAEGDPGAEKALAGIESVLAGESDQFTHEYPCHSPEEQRWFSMAVVPLWLGTAPGAVISHLNMTARKEAEDALRESEERFRIVAEKAQACFGIVQGKRFVYANPYFAEMSGYTAEEILSMDFVEMVHPDYRQRMVDYARRRQLGEAVPTHYEFAMITKSGPTRWIDFAPGLCAYRGRPAIVGTGFDITERKEMEAALRASEEQFAAFMGHLPAAAWIKDAEGRYVYANAESERIFPRGPEEILGRTDEELFPAKAARAFRENDRRALSEGSILTTEVLPQADGFKHHSMVSKFAVPVSSGPALVGGVAFDITQLKLTEEALRESEERYRSVVEMSLDAILITDREGRFTLANPAAELISGYRVEELSGMSFRDLCATDRLEETAAAFREGLEGRSQRIETAMIRKDGRRAELLVSGSPMWKGGAVAGIFVFASDITERKRAETALRQSEELFRLVQSVAKVGVWERHLESGQVTWDPEMERMFGYRPGEFPGSYAGFIDRVHPADLAVFERERNEALAAHRDFNLDSRVLLPSGETRWINLRGGAAYDAAGKPQRIFGASVDITARKQTENQLAASLRDLREAQEELMRRERLATLGQLAGTLAHELRSPLAVIHNSAYFLSQALPQSDATLQEVLAEISRAVGKSNHIITEMLEYVREPSPHSTAVPIGDLIGRALQVVPIPETIHLLPPSAEQAAIEVQVNFNQVSWIFVHLIRNAVQSMAEGGELEISARREPSGFVCIAVCDRGCGIPKENLERIFEPLFSTKVTGIGLGLAIAQRYAQFNGGQLTVESQVGTGSTFKLHLNPAFPQKSPPETV